MHRPRLLLALLLLAIGIAAATMIVSEGSTNSGRPPDTVHASIGLDLPTTQEREDALKIVEASGIVEAISGNQDWGEARLAGRG